MPNSARESGFFSSLKQLLGTVLDIAQVRLELVGTELELEKRRIVDGLIWGALALLCVSIGLALFCGFIILLMWDSYRLAAVGVLAFLFMGLGTFLGMAAKKRMKNPHTMFNASLSELKHDRHDLQQQSSHGPR